MEQLFDSFAPIGVRLSFALFLSLMIYLFTPQFALETDLLRLSIVPTERPPRMTWKGSEATLYYPSSLRFDTRAGQASFRFYLGESLRRIAKAWLVPMLRQLATEKGIPLRRIYIKDVRSRWASCSSLGNVNLNLWLLLLPKAYIYYVMCHELAHFAEMNHSPRFWEVADGILGEGKGRAKATDKALTAYFRAFSKRNAEQFSALYPHLKIQ